MLKHIVQGSSLQRKIQMLEEMMFQVTDAALETHFEEL